MCERDNFPEDGTLDSVSIYISTWSAGGEDVRLALYSGGASVDPNGASLVEDLGVIGSVSTGWRTVNSSTTPSLTSGTKYWLCFKSNAVSGLNVRQQLADPGSNDLTGGWANTTGVTTDETVAWPATIPGSGNTGTTRYFSIYLTYTAGGGVTAKHGYVLKFS
jgi:hypothetical protein